MVTATDFFCGAGGSSTGIVHAGVEVKHAVNHWKLAIETHQTNHPATDHECADIRTLHPSLFPKTDIVWMSPSCTSHSLAKGKKRKNINQMTLWGDSQIDPDEERSRATMREVVDFAEYHLNPIVIVENVVDIRYWQFYDEWLQAMTNLGYLHKTLYLNTQFFGVPQSRDRWYTVFWRKGNKAPDLNFTPLAYCHRCEREVGALQSWKSLDKQWGKYGERNQYIYRCPICTNEVMPYYTPASRAIDWSLPADRIGDRDRPLKEKTIDRIKAGLKKYAHRPFLMETAYGVGQPEHRSRSLDYPMFTQTQRQSFAMLASVNYFDDRCIPLDQPMPTQTTANKLAIVAVLKGDRDGLAISDPLSTLVASASQHALIEVPDHFLFSFYSRENPGNALDMPMPTQTGQHRHGLVGLPGHFLLSYYGRQSAHSRVEQPLTVIPSENRHALIGMPFTISTNHSSYRSRGVGEPFNTIMTQARESLIVPLQNNSSAYIPTQPMGTICTVPKHALLRPPFLVNYFSDSIPLTEPLGTLTTRDRHALIDPLDELVENCTFRMLQPHELQAGMGFPEEYIILGNKRDQVKQIGNAVAPQIAQAIVERCVASLAA